MKDQPILLLTGDEILTLFRGRETDIMDAVASAALIHKTGDATLPHSNFVFFPEKPRDRIVGCRRLLHSEAILAGGSTGGVIMAIEKKREEFPKDAVVAAIIPDRGERYLDTVYSDEWVQKHFGDISHLWSGNFK
ncbi:cysteine synthase [Candidatus Magnetoovum chiemensis]|nr:cysteine synthase [Candidatus Magnetoovum chiemensis]